MYRRKLLEWPEAIRGVAEDTQTITKHIAEIDRQGDKVASEMQDVSALSEEQSSSCIGNCFSQRFVNPISTRIAGVPAERLSFER